MSFVIEIASVSDREDIVAEVWWSGCMVAEINHDTSGEFKIDIYPAESGQPWSFELSAWIDTLSEAQRRLTSRPLEKQP